MEINKCPRQFFNKLVEFMLHYGKRLWWNDETMVLTGVSEQQYVIHFVDGEPVGYVFGNKLVIPEEVI